MKLTAELRPNADLVAFKVGQRLLVATSKIGKSVTRSAIRLVGYVKENKLTDQVVKVRTGRLRRSITYRYTEEGMTFQAFVGTNVSYAKALENGFSGTVNVRGHVVKEHQRKMTIAFGKPMANPRTVTVQAHSIRAHPMKMNIKARHFLRDSLTENTPQITSDLRKAISEGLRS